VRRGGLRGGWFAHWAAAVGLLALSGPAAFPRSGRLLLHRLIGMSLRRLLPPGSVMARTGVLLGPVAASLLEALPSRPVGPAGVSTPLLLLEPSRTLRTLTRPLPVSQGRLEALRPATPP
jgi:hypothetical protein